MPEFSYADLLPTGPDPTEYRQLDVDGAGVEVAFGKEFLRIDPGTLTQLTSNAKERCLVSCIATERLTALAG